VSSLKKLAPIVWSLSHCVHWVIELRTRSKAVTSDFILKSRTPKAPDWLAMGAGERTIGDDIYLSEAPLLRGFHFPGKFFKRWRRSLMERRKEKDMLYLKYTGSILHSKSGESPVTLWTPNSSILPLMVSE